MSAPGCSAPISFDALVDYWFDELAANEEERVEEHLLGCAVCSRRLGSLVTLGAGIRAAFRNGAVGAVISPALLDEMKREGLRLREYPVGPGGSVNCTISAADDAVVSRLQVNLAGASRIDLELLSELGAGRLTDIPFEPSADEVLFCPPAARLKQAPAFVQRIRLLAVDETGERALGDYTFVHTPG
jgi:Putative zinc-finger